MDNDCNGAVDDDLFYFGSDALCAANDCEDVIDTYPQADSGVCWVDPDGTGASELYCERDSAGGGWNLISVVRNNDAPDWCNNNTARAFAL